ncbi:MAG: 50S ribosomal protein L18 [bacterium]
MTDPNIQRKRVKEKLERRRRRVHKKVWGTPSRPRLVVYRSNRHIYAQLVDDLHRRTITGCSSLILTNGEGVKSSPSKVEVARLVGRQLAQLALSKGITQVVFDRNGRRYHGRIRALAEGAREGGLQF